MVTHKIKNDYLENVEVTNDKSVKINEMWTK